MAQDQLPKTIVWMHFAFAEKIKQILKDLPTKNSQEAIVTTWIEFTDKYGYNGRFCKTMVYQIIAFFIMAF